MTRQDLHRLVSTEAQRLGIEPTIALALAHQESGFNPQAKSPTGVVGLFQVTNATGKAYGQTPETRTDPQVSTRAGLSYFRDLLNEAGGDYAKALGRYNGGSDPHFVQHVLRHQPAYQLAQQLYGDESPSAPTPSLEEVLYGAQPRVPERTTAPAEPRAVLDVAKRQSAPTPSLQEVLYGARPALAQETTAPLPDRPREAMAIDKRRGTDDPPLSLEEALYGRRP